MLTTEALDERKWGSFPALRKILAAKQLSHYGFSSVSDDSFAFLHRTLEVALLVHECESEIKVTAKAIGSSEIMSDLRKLEEALGAVKSIIRSSSLEVHRIYLSMHEM